MNLKQFAVDTTFRLRELSPAFKKLEDKDGEPPEQDQVFVTVRQARQEDNMKRAQMVSRREVKYSNDNSVSDVVDENPPRRRMMEAFWTLTGVSNLTTTEGESEVDVFKSLPSKNVSEFEKSWGSLHPVIADAISLAVLKINKLWDPSASGEL